MKIIESALTSTDGYIASFTRNTIEGWWELEVGLPKSWVFEENTKIECEVVYEDESGKVVRIFPKKKGIVIDDLVAFVEIVIGTNGKIAEKEKQFTAKMQEMKDVLEKEANRFYKELDELKENSFKRENSNFDASLEKPKSGQPKPKRGRPPQKKEEKPKLNLSQFVLPGVPLQEKD